MGPLIVIIVGATVMVLAFLWLLMQHRKGTFNLADLVMDDDGLGTRRASIRKFGELIALIASTWVVVYDALDGVNDVVFLTYMGGWVSRTLLGPMTGARANAINAAVGKQEG